MRAENISVDVSAKDHLQLLSISMSVDLLSGATKEPTFAGRVEPGSVDRRQSNGSKLRAAAGESINGFVV